MPKLDMFSENGEPRGQVDVPDEVIGAARLVAGWLNSQPDRYGVAICGLELKVPKQRLLNKADVKIRSPSVRVGGYDLAEDGSRL